MQPLTWCEVSRSALMHNVRELRRAVGARPLLAPVVKANAYGHGTLIAARAFLAAGADWLCVNEVREAALLRAAGLGCPILVVGHVPPSHVPVAADLGLRFVAYDQAVVSAAAAEGVRLGVPVRLHVKVETGNHRQGLSHVDAVSLAALIEATDGVALEGASTHFADVEDTTDHSFAELQLARFRAFVEACRGRGMSLPVLHCANSAAAILWEEAGFDLVRPGIAAYGMWPSKETLISALLERRHHLTLEPALTWKALIAQVKPVSAGSWVGYGRSWQATHDMRLAVVTVGYYDGYDRRLSNQAHVLVRGHRAPVVGRVCMDFIMVDVSDVPDVAPGEEAVLLGASGGGRISAEQLAGWIGTINYEVTTRIGEHVPRIEA
ncbi:MAG: alanine racemase [Myxococcales bacterium]